jgi:flagellar biosynthesis/type III secretory pathway protein FliH
MPRVSDLLDRFRPAGAPGPAGAAGVPAGRGAAAQEEPGPVFAALSTVEHQCAALGEAARTAARELTEQAQREAAELIRRAQADAEAERAQAAARLRTAAEDELAGLVARAEAEAREIRERTAHRLPALVELVLAHVRVELSALVGDENVPVPAPAAEVHR